MDAPEILEELRQPIGTRRSLLVIGHPSSHDGKQRAQTTPALIGAKEEVEVAKKKTPRETQFPHQVPEGVSESSLLRLRSIIRLEINAVAGNGTCAV